MKKGGFRILFLFLMVLLLPAFAGKLWAGKTDVPAATESRDIKPGEEGEEPEGEDPVEEKKNGWVDEDGGRYYYVDDRRQTGWQEIEGETYDLGDDGRAKKSCWVSENGNWYYFGPDFRMVKNSIVPDSVGKCYVGADGRAVKNTWVLAGDDWYWIQNDFRALANNWKQDSGGWCYLQSDGRAARNKWISWKGAWYYLKDNCRMAANEWANDSGGACFLQGDGKAVKNKWISWKGDWYYLKGDYHRAAGEWAKDSGGWCYLNSDGRAAKNAWIRWKNDWYYLKSNCRMAASEWASDSRGLCYLDGGGRFIYRGVKKSGYMVRQSATKALNGKLIVLDPGHSANVASGTEPLGPGSSTMKAKCSTGTRGVSTGLFEYQLNMTIADSLLLELLNRGYSVVLTRSSNSESIGNIARTQVANTLQADAYLRIHANGGDSSARGALAVCISSGNPWKKSKYSICNKLSQCVLTEYCKATGLGNRGTWYTDSMTGNNWSDVPCVLFEMGFMTNAAEDQWMANSANQKKMVQGLANGLDSFFK